MKNKKLADIDFKLEWKSPFAEHTDIFRVHKVDIDNDKLPADFAKKVAALKVGKSCSQTFPAKDLLDEPHSSHKMIRFKPALFDSNFKGQNSPAILYRFYPSAIAWQGLDTDVSDYAPFRLISMSDDTLVGDRNHPLSKYYLTLTASKIKEVKAPDDNERRRRHIGKLITFRGPGMQAPFEYGDPVFFAQYPFQRSLQYASELKDDQQVSKPQLDSIAIEEITKLHSELLPKYSKVLDLMSGESSFLNDDYEAGLLSGIGTNEEALNANQRLDTYQLQDLNTNVVLPFEDNSFDDAICTLAIETLTDPLEVMKEIARVINPEGKFIITFSNNNFPDQAISLWSQLHPFERTQLVLEYFRQTGLFKEINTFSKRGVLKLIDSKNHNKKHISEPVYAVWGTVR
ncbi:MAG: class I SAM-dependent methyltransferase [Cocleimonas sp.]